jgi:hypothetical protein
MSDGDRILHPPLHYVVGGELYVSGFSHIVAEGVTK